MENKFLEQFIKRVKNVKLTRDEKSEVLRFLEAFIKINPVRINDVVRQLKQRSFFYNLRIKTMPIIAIIAIVSLLGGGVSAAAEASVPGDLLYTIKVSVNEEVRAALAFSADAKAQWEARRAERRLEEAEELASEGKLDVEARAELEEKFVAHAEKVKERVAEFEAHNNFRAAADVTSNFETSLRAHERVLAKLAKETEDDDEEEELELFIKIVGDHKSDIVRVRLEIEDELKDEDEDEKEDGTEAQEAAEGKLKSTENKIKEVSRFVEKVKAELGTSATAEAEARLLIASNTVAEGKVKLAAGTYGEAFILFQKAHRIVQEAKLLVEARKELEIDVEINGDDAEEDEEEDEIEVKTEAETEVKSGRGSGKGEIRVKVGL